jgi:N-acetylglucosaminyl-diphospho-decaprenol L-rhamnosyltransferase
LDLTISIVNWNTRDLLDQCIQSIVRNTTGIEWELIVVDNASSDNSVEMIASKYPSVTLIKNNNNVGFAAANNQAYDISHGRYFMLLNSDTIVLNDLSGVVKYLDEHEEAGVASCKCLNQDRSLQLNWYDYYPSFLWEMQPEIVRNWMLYAIYHRNPDVAFITKWVGGQCMTVRRACIEKVGVMDTDYFMYSEETDWCYRIRNAGWEIHHCPDIEIIHFGGQSTKKIATKMLIELYGSKVRFIRKNLSVWQSELFVKGLLARTIMLRGLMSLLKCHEKETQLTELLKAIPEL